jgi:hypothetical protein
MEAFMATYVFFEGYGEWFLENADEDMDKQYYEIPVKKGYECGYFMLNEMQEMCYKHAGKLLPHYLYPCFDENIKLCAFRELMNDPKFKDCLNQERDFLVYAYFRIDEYKKYSLVVVDLKDIQTVDQPPAQNSSQESEVSTMHALNNQSNPNYISKDLAILNRAAIEIWGSVDPTDKETHPERETVIKWLKLNKISSEASAKQGATIIRPDWANRGRPPLKKEV